MQPRAQRLQRAQRRAGLYYQPVHDCSLDGLLKELIYPGLFANLGCGAQPRLRQAEPLLPFGLAPCTGGGAGGVGRCLARVGWGPCGVPAGITLLLRPEPWLGPQQPLRGVPVPAVGCPQSPGARRRLLPSPDTPREPSFPVASRREPSLKIHIDIKKGPSVPIN